MNRIGKLACSFVCLAASAGAWADEAQAGLWQKKVSGWSTTADPSDGGTLVPGALLASCPAGTYTDGGTTYTMGNNQTWAYSGYMYMEGGVTYRFVKNYDDSGCVIITDPETGESTTVLTGTTYSETKYGTYTPADDGYYPIYLAVYNNTGGIGPTVAPFNSASQLGAGLAWTDDPSVTSCTTSNYNLWHKFLNDPDDPIFFTSAPYFSPLKILPIPAQHVQAGKHPEPGFTVTNRTTGASWVLAEGGVSSNATPFDVSYGFSEGKGSVTVTGKAGGEYEGEEVTREYVVTDELLVNGGFESGRKDPGWTGTLSVGNSSSAYNPNYSTTFISGTYCGIIQMSNYAQQVFTVSSACRATLSWKCKHRDSYNTGTPMYYTVLLDGEVIHPEEKTTGNTVLYRSIESLVLTPGEHTLVFQGRTDNNADSTLFLDDVSLRAVSPLMIYQLPDQYSLFGEIPAPGFAVTNFMTGANWTFGPGGTSAGETPFNVAYSYGDGYGVVTVTGKPGSEMEGEFTSHTFRICRRVKSLTSTGTQYINTGIVPGTTTAVEMHFNTTNCEYNTAFFGSGGWNTANAYMLYYTGSCYYFRAGGTSLGVQHESGMDGFLSISTNAANNSYVNFGGNVATRTLSLAYAGSTPLAIFSTGNGASKSKLTVYSFKIWQSGELVRDFVPVRCGGVSGLYDLKNDKFYGNAGTGDFEAGPFITDIDVARIPGQVYTGTALEPAVVVSNFAGTALLAKDVDYTVAYADNAAAGTGKAIVTGIGAYSSVVTNTFSIYAMPAAPALPASAYIQNGLMNHWDALDNAGTGTFDPTARTWKDLKGGLDFSLNGNADWGEGFLETHGYSGAAPGKAGKYLTIEARYCNTKNRRGMMFASGYSQFRVLWNRSIDQLWFHHANNEYRSTLTGLNTAGTTYDFSVVYGAANGGADSPMLFYDGGVRKTAGITYQNWQTSDIAWVTSFPNATIGGASATAYNYEGRLYSIRLYECPLSAREIAYNAAVDKVRYEGVAPAEAFNAPDMRWNATSGKVEVLISVGLVNGGGTLSINGGGTSTWVPVGGAVKIVYTPVEGEKALEWFDLPDGAPRTSDLFTVNFTAEAPVAATLQMLKKIDITRALNADPGIEEGPAAIYYANANRTSFPVSWARTSTQAGVGAHGSSSDVRGWYYLSPYQGSSFYQPGLALPAGSYTLTFDHYANVTDHTIYEWRLYDATNGVHSICAVTNEMRVYGTAWHTVQQDFTVAEGGIYKLQTVKIANGAHGNCYSLFDNISITSDTDLHIEVEKCYPYFGEGQARPPVVVRDDAGNILTEGVDYELLYGANDSVGSGLDYNGNTVPGNGFVAAKGLGDHYGVAGANFRLGKPIFVKPDGLPTNSGTNWNEAVDFATALTLAATPHANSEIWIAGSNVLAAAAQTQYFFGNKIFRGGFKGTESTIEEREDGAYSTIDGDGQFTAVSFADCANVHFDRLRFRGSPSRAVSKTGWSGNVFIDDCIFEENGNAVYVQGIDKSPYDQGSLYVKDSVFRNNHSTDDANGAAAIYSYLTRRVSAENTLFASNTVTTTTKAKVGAIYANSSAVELTACDFIDNLVDGVTYGTVRAYGINAPNRIEHCLFRGNRTDGANGAAVTIEHSTLAGLTEIVNSTFAANANATAGGCAGVKASKGQIVIRNSIFHGNGGTDFADSANASCDVDYTLLANDTDATHSFVHGSSKLGGSMVYGDPLFAAADDCHLLSEAGYFDAEGVIHYAAAGVRSPAIDAGDPASDFSRESEPNGGCVNLGRYGNTEQASRTPSATPAVGTPTVEWNDPDGYSMPTITFTMGGSGSYTAHGVVYVSTDGGSTWVDVSGTIGGLVNGQTKVFRIPAYYAPRSTIRVKVVVSGSGQESESAVASSTVPASKSLPPWYNKKGPNNVIHMRPGAIGRNDGTSWTDAFASWADALAAASSLKNEIWIAGTNLVTVTVPTKAFAFPAAIRGGFTGVETAASQRPAGLRSVIDGQNQFDTFNFSNTESLVIDSIEFLRGGYRGLKKTTSAGDVTLTNCVFYGCTRGMGNWDGNGNSNISYQYGGGGAGLYGSGGAKATVVDCRFEANIITSAGGNGGFGGGLYVGNFGGGAEIYRCSFVTNYMQRGMDSSSASMSGLHVYNTRATVDGCSFYGHYSEGIADVNGNCSGSVFRRCSFVGNYGGRIGVLQVKLSNATDTTRIENCTFAYNLGSQNPALICSKGAVAVTNCIFYGNLAKVNATGAVDIRVAADASATVDYCLFAVPESEGSTICVSETTPGSLQIGPNCIYGDPLFETDIETVLAQAKAPEGSVVPRAMPSNWTWSWSNPSPSFAIRASYDVHLRSHFGYMLDGVPHKHFKENSPAIDAGDPKSDYSLEPWIPGMGYHGGRINLGAYGNTREAAMSPFRASMLILR